MRLVHWLILVAPSCLRSHNAWYIMLKSLMAWCRQATSHYLSQFWPRSLSPYSITMLQCIKGSHVDYSVITGCPWGGNVDHLKFIQWLQCNHDQLSVSVKKMKTLLYPRPKKLEGGILDSPCPSVRPSVCPSVFQGHHFQNGPLAAILDFLVSRI